MEKISAVYKIVNEVTGDSYVGSSRNVFQRWVVHKLLSTWKRNPNKALYKDMQKYGVDKFRFQILAPVMEEHLKDVEQEFIEMLSPTYNNNRAKGLDIKRVKEWWQSYRGKESRRKYDHKLCSYKGKTLTLHALYQRFRKAGVEHPTTEAKKYLIK